MRNLSVYGAMMVWGVGAGLGRLEAVPLAEGMKLGIDYGPMPTAAWNNIVSLNQSIPAGSVVNLAGQTVDGVSIATENCQFSNLDGTNAWAGLAVHGGSAPPEFVESVVTDIAGNYSLVPDDTPYRTTLSGLDPALMLRLDLVATATGSPVDTFRVIGQEVHGPSAIARASARQGAFHTFAGVRAKADGTLVIEVTDSGPGKNPIVNGILITVGEGNPMDSDGDGLEDAWEIRHFGNLVQGAAGDYDQDGETNLAEFEAGTDPADITSHGGAVEVWQIDFQGGTGGAFGSVDPVTATADLGYGMKWNAFQIEATNAAVFANPPTEHNAVMDPVLDRLFNAQGQKGKVKLAIAGGVSGYNAGRILNQGGVNHAFGDHWFWGAQGRTSATLGFTFSNLRPGTYSLTAYANPDQHEPPRDFGLVAGGTTVPIRPVHAGSFYANPGTFAGTVREIEVDGSGLLQGSLTTLAGDPSLAAMVLRRVEDPTEAMAVPDAVEMHAGGKWRARVLENDVVIGTLEGVEIVVPPQAGTAVVQDDGSILYTHGGGSGGDAFRYRFHDASGLSNEAEVSVAVVEGPLAASTLRLPEEPPVTEYFLEDAFKGRGDFNFGTPTWMATIPGNAKRFFVSERTGVIWEIPDMAARPATRRVFLDLGGKLDLFTEMGVKSFAFHPQFESGQPYLFVTYNYEESPSSAVGSVRLSRFTVGGAGLDAVDPGSEQVLFEIDSRSQDHNLNSCRFGPDGYLYVGFGDERRPGENCQMITNLFWSSVIRIDVDRRPENLEPNPAGNPSLTIPTSGGLAFYKVPVDNPYAAGSGTVAYLGASHPWDGVRSEIYVTGVRNPWQFCFDTIDGEPVLWLGDVGSDGAASREEVNLFRKGDNGGWDHVEGDRFNRTPPEGTAIRAPEWFYSRGSGAYQGASVTGGLVVTSPMYPDLMGKYLFGDWLSGHLWTLQRGEVAGQPAVERIGGLAGVVGFATDPANGEILVLSWNSEAGGLFDGSGQLGKVFRLKAATVSGSAFPATLSATGAFADPSDLTPNPGLHFYEPNVSFWSDHAKKSRWFGLPAGEGKLGYTDQGPFESPAGTVWIKHFDLEMERGNPATRKRLETRFLVKKEDGGVYGISYKWNEEGSEATLVGDAGESLDLEIHDPSRPEGQQQVAQRWQIPSRAQCLACHQPGAGYVLGFDHLQLNREDVPFEGTAGNYIRRLADAGYLTGAPEDPAALPRHHRADEEGVRLEARVRSYLEVNCAYCHADEGGLDLRASVPLEESGLLHVADGGQIAVSDPLLRRILPGHPEHSSVWQRVRGAEGFNRMPPLGSGEIDEEAVALLRAWIEEEANAAPVFENRSPFLVVAPDAAPGTVAGRVAANDPDAPRDVVRYAIAGAAGPFAIDPVSGILTVQGSLSSLGGGVAVLTVEAADDFAANPKTARVVVRIDTSGENAAPRFRSPSLYYVPANLAAGSGVGRVMAEDPEGGDVSYEKTGGSPSFTVDPSNGMIRVAGSLTAGSEHSLAVRASDGNGTAASADLTIAIRVTAGESAMMAAESGRVFWNIDFQGDGSSTAAGQTTAPVTSTAGGMFWNAFQVKAYSGNPSAMSPNPAMALKTHEGGAPTAVEFRILTDEDPATDIGSGVFGYSGRAGANSLTGDYLLLLQQGGANGAEVHAWEIRGLSPGWSYDLLMQGGYDGSTTRGTAFVVDTDGDGSLADESPVYLTAAADPVTNSCVIRSVTADGTGRIAGRSSRTPPPGQTWNESNWAGMQIRTAQGSPPVFIESGPFAVEENLPAGTPVGTVSARDPENDGVTYALESSHPLFAMHPQSGLLTLAASPDYEAASLHLLEVKATDARGLESRAWLEVRVGNVADSNAEHVEAWLESLGHAGEGAWNDDPDGDGICHAFEMLFGSDPFAGNASPVRPGEGGSLEVEVSAAAADRLDFHLEYSLDCRSWQETGTEPVVIRQEGERRTLRFAGPALEPEPESLFLRLKMDP